MTPPVTQNRCRSQRGMGIRRPSRSAKLPFSPPIPGPRPKPLAGSAGTVLRAPRPAPLPIESPPRVLSKDVEEVRQELRAFAERCRAFADVCEDTARRLDNQKDGPKQVVGKPKQANPAQEKRVVGKGKSKPLRVPDTLPVLCEFDIVDEWMEIPFDWDDENQATLVHGQADDDATLTWERPVQGSGVASTLPPPVFCPCPSCGHGNGLQYSCCTACGCRLRPEVLKEPAQEAVIEPVQKLGERILNWLKRMDPRRPRWMDPDVLDRVSVGC